MTIKLWGRYSSSNVQKVVFALEELGLAYEQENRGGAFGGLDDPAYLAMNPNGLVPVLRDGDLLLWESSAIVRYLAARYGAGTLWPIDPVVRAEADKWTDWTLSTLQPQGIGQLFLNVVRTPPAQQKPEAIAAATANATRLYGMLDRHLADRVYILGDTLTYADVIAGQQLYRWMNMPFERPSLPNLEAWYARLCQRPAYTKAICIPFDDLYVR